VDGLIAEELIVEKRGTPKGRGRVPILLSLNPEAFLVAGASIRVDQTAVCIAGANGNLHAQATFRTPSKPGPFLEELRRAVNQVLTFLPGKRPSDIREMCISVPGLVRLDTGEIHWIPSLPRYSGFALGTQAQAATGIRTAVANDCELAAVAEVWFSKDPSHLRDFVFLDIGPVGVGAGVMINGELCKGHAASFAGVFGHIVIAPSGPLCECGRRGCWECYVSDRATWARYDPQKKLTTHRFRRLIQRAREGEDNALRVFRETAQYLSLGISNIMFALNPQLVITSGSIVEVWDAILPVLLTAYASPRIEFRVRPSTMKAEDLFLRGAVIFALSDLYAKPEVG